MRIRMSDNMICEWPDVVGIWILADPSHGECSETFTFDQVNGLLHAGIALFYDDRLTIEENAKNIIKEFLEVELPTEENWSIATSLVESYNKKATDENIGIVSPDFF